MATNPISDRLEELRKRVGVPTVQEFVRRLNAGADTPFPYATASRYHATREPPVGYLREVVRTFEARWEWLVTGEGELTERDQKREETLSRVTGLLEMGKSRLVEEVATALPDLPAGARDVVTRLAWDLQLDQVEDPVEVAADYFPDRVSGTYGEQMARILAHAQVAYLTRFGSESTDQEV